jgi:hypothetical protein
MLHKGIVRFLRKEMPVNVTGYLLCHQEGGGTHPRLYKRDGITSYGLTFQQPDLQKLLH